MLLRVLSKDDDDDMNDLFSKAGPVDPRYAFVRDHAPDFRQRLQQEWARFQDLADPDFEAQLAQDFESRAWEMRVGAMLREFHGSNAVSSKPHGLDFRVDTGPRTIWVECVAPTPGQGHAAVQPVPTTHADFIDADAVMLRYSSAIWDKRENQVKRERKNGSIGENDAVVIALSAAKIEVARSFEPQPEDWPADPPWIFRLLFGYGGERWVATDGGTRTFFPRDPTTPKAPRDPNDDPQRIATAYFAFPEFAEISAVLFTARDTQNRRWDRHVRDDLALFHNPLATNPVPRGWLRGGTEFAVDKPESGGRQLIRRTDLRADS